MSHLSRDCLKFCASLKQAIWFSIFDRRPYAANRTPPLPKVLFLLLSITLFHISCTNQPVEEEPAKWEPNYDESKISDYSLPELLTTIEGKEVNSKEDWEEKRRPEILKLFAEQVYGRTPTRSKDTLWWEVKETNENALNGLAIRQEIQCYFTADPEGPSMQLMLYLPKEAPGPVPVFFRTQLLWQSLH